VDKSRDNEGGRARKSEYEECVSEWVCQEKDFVGVCASVVYLAREVGLNAVRFDICV
jgi:hypothetical protein